MAINDRKNNYGLIESATSVPLALGETPGLKSPLLELEVRKQLARTTQIVENSTYTPDSLEEQTKRR